MDGSGTDEFVREGSSESKITDSSTFVLVSPLSAACAIAEATRAYAAAKEALRGRKIEEGLRDTQQLRDWRA